MTPREQRRAEDFLRGRILAGLQSRMEGARWNAVYFAALSCEAAARSDWPEVMRTTAGAAMSEPIAALSCFLLWAQCVA